MGAVNGKEASQNCTPGAAKAIGFEVILSPSVKNAKMPQLTPKKEGVLTRQAIDDKIAAAEKRRKERQFSMRLRLANDDEHVEEVRQAMSDYQERKRRETEERYQRRLFTFNENQEALANERARQWQKRARRLEAAQETVQKHEKSFRESVKVKITQKVEKFRENCNKYHVSRQEAARLREEKMDAVQDARERQQEEKATATAEKIKRKFQTREENRETNISKKVEKIQRQQAKIEETREALERSLEVSSAKKMKRLEEKLDKSAVKRQLFEEEVRQKARMDLDKVDKVRQLREEQVQKFSDSTMINLEHKFENAEKVREHHIAVKKQSWQKQNDREKKVKSSVEESEGEKLKEKIEEKQQRSEENRMAILNAKVQVCQEEYAKAKMIKENMDEKIRSQAKEVEESIQAKLNAYKENRQRRMSERKITQKKPATNQRYSLKVITNDCIKDAKVKSPKKDGTTEVSGECENSENLVDAAKLKKLAENFRKRNLEHFV